MKTPACLLFMVLFHGCATAWVKAPEAGPVQGIASWYGEEFAGRVTASGDIFDPLGLTAAHPALPFGTLCSVTNLQNGQTVEVRINDRGPYIRPRIIDLSYGAAEKIGLVQPGIGMVELKVIQLGDGKRVRPTAVLAGSTSSKLDDEPPAVPFPLPTEVRSPAASKVAEENAEFDLEVIEERSGVPTRRRVSAGGRELEIVSVETGAVIASAVTAPPPQSSEKFILQLGAFQIEENAEALRKRAAKVVSSVYIEPSMGFFRVRAGPFTSRDRAVQIQNDLRAAALPSLLLTE